MTVLEMDPGDTAAARAKALYEKYRPRGACARAKASAGRIWRCSTIRSWPSRRGARLLSEIRRRAAAVTIYQFIVLMLRARPAPLSNGKTM